MIQMGMSRRILIYNAYNTIRCYNTICYLCCYMPFMPFMLFMLVALVMLAMLVMLLSLHYIFLFVDCPSCITHPSTSVAITRSSPSPDACPPAR